MSGWADVRAQLLRQEWPAVALWALTHSEVVHSLGMVVWMNYTVVSQVVSRSYDLSASPLRRRGYRAVRRRQRHWVETTKPVAIRPIPMRMFQLCRSRMPGISVPAR